MICPGCVPRRSGTLGDSAIARGRDSRVAIPGAGTGSSLLGRGSRILLRRPFRKIRTASWIPMVIPCRLRIVGRPWRRRPLRRMLLRRKRQKLRRRLRRLRPLQQIAAGAGRLRRRSCRAAAHTSHCGSRRPRGNWSGTSADPVRQKPLPTCNSVASGSVPDFWRDSGSGRTV